jgi:protein-S-isoprenylcysteine O-methyltransferase Ste14
MPEDKEILVENVSIPRLVAKLVTVSVIFLGALGGILFGLAGTWDYPGAWILLGAFILIVVSLFSYYLRKDPEFLRKRMDYSEREKPQRSIIGLSFFPFTAIFVIPALDRRFGWTPFSWPLIITGLAVFALSYLALLAVFAANRYAARTVKIQEGQKVIDTGPYAIVRHPMYALVPIIYAGVPLILQSPWGLLPLPLMVAVLVPRILNEEKVLIDGLPGYAEYMKKVRWRLLPLVW